MTDDDTKFKRARRERPHIEAFAQLQPMSPTPLPSLPQRQVPATIEELLARWSHYDEIHGVRTNRP